MRKLGGNFCEPVQDRMTDEITYKVYKDWVLIDECDSHVEAVQKLHEALSDGSEIVSISHGSDSLVETELDTLLGVV